MSRKLKYLVCKHSIELVILAALVMTMFGLIYWLKFIVDNN